MEIRIPFARNPLLSAPLPAFLPAMLPIGIFDSGVGGLTVARAVRRAFPGAPVLYFGDTARVPYGGKSPETVRHYAHEIGGYLTREGVSCLVVACNTASALALDSLALAFPGTPVLGVVGPGAQAAVSATRNSHIGVIGTRATVASGAYDRAIHALNPLAKITSTPCPLFVPLVEEMWLEGAITGSIIARYLDPLLAEGIDTLVLGCTHYPFLEKSIAEYCGESVVIVDSATATATALKKILGAAATSQSQPSLDVILTDTPVQFLELANAHLDLQISPENVTLVSPDKLVS